MYKSNTESREQKVKGIIDELKKIVKNMNETLLEKVFIRKLIIHAKPTGLLKKII